VARFTLIFNNIKLALFFRVVKEEKKVINEPPKNSFNDYF
jgi:hypothetical protein